MPFNQCLQHSIFVVNDILPVARPHSIRVSYSTLRRAIYTDYLSIDVFVHVFRLWLKQMLQRQTAQHADRLISLHYVEHSTSSIMHIAPYGELCHFFPFRLVLFTIVCYEFTSIWWTWTLKFGFGQSRMSLFIVAKFGPTVISSIYIDQNYSRTFLFHFVNLTHSAENRMKNR